MCSYIESCFLSFCFFCICFVKERRKKEKFEGKVCVNNLQKTCGRLTIGDMYCHENESDKTLYSIDLL
jgi:hypothetical protein